MKNLPLNQLGPHEARPGVVDLGILLPWIPAANGNRLFVKIIHERDQLIQAIQPVSFELQHGIKFGYSEYRCGEPDRRKFHRHRTERAICIHVSG